MLNFAARLCIAGSFSKTYAMTGWRVGYALAPPLDKEMLKVQGHSTSNPNSIAQSAAVEALNGPQESVAKCLANTRTPGLAPRCVGEIPGLSCNEPEGAFYAFPSVSGCLKGDIENL